MKAAVVPTMKSPGVRGEEVQGRRLHDVPRRGRGLAASTRCRAMTSTRCPTRRRPWRPAEDGARVARVDEVRVRAGRARDGQAARRSHLRPQEAGEGRLQLRQLPQARGRETLTLLGATRTSASARRRRWQQLTAIFFFFFLLLLSLPYVLTSAGTPQFRAQRLVGEHRGELHDEQLFRFPEQERGNVSSCRSRRGHG